VPIDNFQVYGFRMLLRLIDVFVLYPSEKSELEIKCILQTIWKSLKMRETEGNANEIRLSGWDCLSSLSCATPAVIQIVITSLLEIFEAERWADLDLIPEVLSAVSDASFTRNLYRAPIERTLLTFASSLVSRSIFAITPSSSAVSVVEEDKGDKSKQNQ
jgi:hypothetical protein